jgi:two-component system chemotaxis response regulator CheB
MFRSIALNVGPNAIGVLLTGMGNDGAQGLKEMHETGSCTIIQDEKTSVVWGMPGEAFKIGAVDIVEPIDSMAARILKTLQKLEKAEQKALNRRIS